MNPTIQETWRRWVLPHLSSPVEPEEPAPARPSGSTQGRAIEPVEGTPRYPYLVSDGRD